MTNKTITLSRDHVERLIDRLSKAQMFKEVTELRAALADPVPPAGGEPEVYAYMVRKPNGSDHLDFENEYPSDAGYKISELIRLSDHRAHVTRLQAEVERLTEQIHTRTADLLACGTARKILQSELTKARELIQKISDTACGYLPEIKAYLSNQSAPADKGDPEDCAHSEANKHGCPECGEEFKP